MPKRFVSGALPHIRKADFKGYSTTKMMINVIIAFIPLAIFAFVKNGLLPFINNDTNAWGLLRPLVFIIIAGLVSFGSETISLLIMKKKDFKFSSSWIWPSLIPGFLLAMTLPLNTPIWVLIIGTAFGVVVGKMFFGGFGYNVFNPALIGRIFIMTAFYGVIASNGGYLNPTEASSVVDVVSGVTPLTEFTNVINGTMNFSRILSDQGGLLNNFLGFSSGALGETSALLCIVAYIYLSVTKTINWKMPIVFVGTIFIFTYLLGLRLGYSSIEFPVFNVLVGGVMFGGVFMVTEPVTGPRDPIAKLLYAMLIAVLAMTLRYVTGFAEGVASSILFMNMLSPMIDRHCSALRVEQKISKKLIGYSVYAVIIILIVVFTIVKVGM